MPLSALPEHLRDVENHFPDDDQYGTNWFGRAYRWYQKKTKTWFCFSYRCTEWWARWRKYPIVLFALGGKGPWRIESALDDHAYDKTERYLWMAEAEGCYLSRIQYWKRWHVAVQWPLMFSCHVYPKAADVPVYGQPRPDTDGKLWFFYWNHFDADWIYWMVTSIFFGRVWK